jgi:hypothetical protein
LAAIRGPVLIPRASSGADTKGASHTQIPDPKKNRKDASHTQVPEPKKDAKGVSTTQGQGSKAAKKGISRTQAGDAAKVAAAGSALHMARELSSIGG